MARAMMQGHAAISARIARNVPDFQTIATVIRQHHERLDGSGYPDGIRGEEQLAPARVLAVADVFDALTSERPYREAMSHDRAIDVIRRERGTQLDVNAVDALIELTDRGQIDGALQYAYCLTH